MVHEYDKFMVVSVDFIVVITIDTPPVSSLNFMFYLITSLVLIFIIAQTACVDFLS
jgi:hypothetical protein